METPSTTQQPNANPPYHHPPNLFTLTRLQSPRPGYTSAGAYRPPPDPLLEPSGSRTERPPLSSPTSLPTSSSSWRGGEDVVAGRGLPSQGVGRNGPDEDLGVAGGPGDHGAWDGRGSTADEFHGKDEYCRYVDRVFHVRHSVGNERDARDTFDTAFLNDGDTPSYNRSDSYETVKYETVYDKDMNSGCYGNHNTSYNSRDAFRQSSVDEGLSDSYLGRDPGSSQSSFAGGSTQVGEGGLWRGGGAVEYFQGLHASALKPLSSNGRYMQKLDSFSEAFQSYQRRGGFLQAVPNVGPAGHLRGEYVGWAAAAVDGSQGCLYGSPVDSYVPTHSAFPSLPSLPSLASPPHPSQLLPSLLSPPPTPLPPSSLSPSLVDCSHPFGTFAGHPVLREGDTVGTINFFLPHGNPQQSCDPRAIAEGNLRTNKDDDRVYSPERHSVLMAPESFMSCSPLTPSPLPASVPTSSSLHPSRALGCPPLLYPSFHPAHLPSRHQRKEGHIASCTPQTQEAQSGSPSQSYTKVQSGTPRTYSGNPFPSVLRRRKVQGHYTPWPILDPIRQGAGLYITVASLSGSPQDMVRGGDAEEQSPEEPCINIGPDFQAALPTCSPGWGEESSPRPPAEEASPREQLLWKPFALLEESAAVQGHVERLLSMCNSSCLPGGGANTELALHCLHHCHGDTMATLEMLLFSLPTATGDYHYSGSDVWTVQESTAFSQGLRTLGKDFSLIQKMVTTKRVRQCVEFYYLGKRLADMQRRQTDRETDRQRETEEQAAAAQAVNQQVTSAPQPIRTPLGPERAVPATPLAAYFPCKMCGKMFYKIKSRNAHMKIHRQPQEDWGERSRLQAQLLAHRHNAPHGLTLSLGSTSLLLPQAPTGAYSFPGLTLPPTGHDGHPDPGALNPFEATDSNSSSSGSGGAVDHASNMRIKNCISSTVAAFSNAGEENPLAVPADDVSDSAANQRGPPTAQSPVHQSWTLWMG